MHWRRLIDDLFAEIPADLRVNGLLNTPEGLDEHAIGVELAGLPRSINAGQHG